MSNVILQRHFFHIVSSSPWPLIVFFCILGFMSGVGFYMHGYLYGYVLMLCSFCLLLIVMGFWWDDIVNESIVGFYSNGVRNNLQIGIILFIVSEVMFFFAFFWAFFCSSLSPVYQIGCFWPPEGLSLINIYAVPLLNTFILLLSGLCITIVHERLLCMENELEEFSFWGVLLSMYMYASGSSLQISSLYNSFLSGTFSTTPLIGYHDFLDFALSFIVIGYFYLNDSNTWVSLSELMNNYYISIFWFILTLLLALLFLFFQVNEYINASFGISDGIYGTVFYLATGFHGFHVFIGFVYLFICFCRFILNHFNWASHVGLQGAIWYWHFVDGVWLFLYIWIYCWGSLGIL